MTERLDTARDTLLTARARAGDQHAIVELWTQHYPATLAAARRYANQPRDAEEIASDAFAGMLAALASGKGPADSVRGYLVTSVRNLAASRARRSSASDVLTDSSDTFDRAGHTPTDPVARLGELGLVREAFSTLPRRWQTVLWRSAVDADSNVAIGHDMGISPNAVAALSRRARRGLRTAYLQAHVSRRGVTPQCQPYIAGLADFAVNEEAATNRLRRHISGCLRCTARVAELRLIERELGAVLTPLLALLPARPFTPLADAAGSTQPDAAGGAQAEAAGAASGITPGATGGAGGPAAGSSGWATAASWAAGAAAVGVAAVALAWPEGPANRATASAPGPTTGSASALTPRGSPDADAKAERTRSQPSPSATRRHDAGARARAVQPTGAGSPTDGSTPVRGHRVAEHAATGGHHTAGSTAAAEHHLSSTGSPTTSASSSSPPRPDPGGSSPSRSTSATTPPPRPPQPPNRGSLTMTLSGTATDTAVLLTARLPTARGPVTLRLTVPDGVRLLGTTGDWRGCHQNAAVVTCNGASSRDHQWIGTVHLAWPGAVPERRLSAAVQGRSAHDRDVRAQAVGVWPGH